MALKFCLSVPNQGFLDDGRLLEGEAFAGRLWGSAHFLLLGKRSKGGDTTISFK